MFSRFRRRDHTRSDVHDYIQRVLQKGDHGRNRVLICDAQTLNHALESNLQGIGRNDVFLYTKIAH